MNLASVIFLFVVAASGLIAPLRSFALPKAAPPTAILGQSEPEKAPLDQQPSNAPSTQSEPAKTQSEPAAQSSESPAATSQSDAPSVAPAPGASGRTDAAATSKKCRKSKSGKCLKSQAAGAPPKKVVVRNGSTSEPEVKLAPTVPTDIASQQTLVTEQLLAAAENNLKQAGTKQLNADQTAVAEQIRNYIDQARAATKAGDVQRSHNLAVKARLLSDDLVAH